ncbi:zinc-binding loop region of homing endonuclease-domain-containing protein [Lipomyces starkeyi]
MNAHNLDNITPTMANNVVNSHHHRTTSLGCWESDAKTHLRGYPIVCVSTGAKPFTTGLHRIALIADGRHDELRATLHGYGYDVSYLCHNRKCFNPEHLVVESRLNNRRRQACSGHKILVGDGFSYHPCAHGSVEKMRKCILSDLQVTMPNSEAQASTEETPAPNPDGIATVSNDADADAGKLGHITPAMAQQLINKYRAVTTDHGCWQSRLKPDRWGYCRVDLTNLQVRPLLHQLALIADNRGAELKGLWVRAATVLCPTSATTSSALIHNI